MSDTYKGSDFADTRAGRASFNDSAQSNAAREALTELSNGRSINSDKNSQLSAEWPDCQIVDSPAGEKQSQQSEQTNSGETTDSRLKSTERNSSESEAPKDRSGLKSEETNEDGSVTRRFEERQDGLVTEQESEIGVGRRFEQREDGLRIEMNYKGENGKDGIRSLRYFANGDKETTDINGQAKREPLSAWAPDAKPPNKETSNQTQNVSFNETDKSDTEKPAAKDTIQSRNFSGQKDGLIEETEGKNYVSRVYEGRKDGIQRVTEYKSPVGNSGLKRVVDRESYQSREYEGNPNGLKREYEYKGENENGPDKIKAVRQYSDGTSEAINTSGKVVRARPGTRK